MKTLYESLLDDFEKLEASTNPINEIKQFLEDNYSNSDKLKISKEPNKDGLYEVDCTSCSYVEVINKEIASLTNGLFVFTNVKHFWCSWCKNLTSLEGAPKETKFGFRCVGCINLKSLKGAPEKVGEHFECFNCESLTSLEGAPEKVGYNFHCGGCRNLTTLKGAPKKIKGVFDCSSCVNLTSLEGAPKEVGVEFNCSVCTNLKTLKGAPKKAGSFYCGFGDTKFKIQDVRDVCDVKGSIHA